MAIEDDVARVAEQERALVFPRFDEAAAFAIGSSIKAAAEAKGVSLAIDVRTWDRPLFYFSMPGATADNAEWIRRKSNCVRRFSRASYAVSVRLQLKSGTTLFAADDGIEPMDVAGHGGSFPIRVAGTGVIGAITVSGVPGRDDHGFVVAAIAAHLGLDPAALALPPV
jgi:uncharacterized protein (UPF0303 family)